MESKHIKIARRRILMAGRVQGVGFRYHVLKLAEKNRLNGFVSNCSTGVCIEVEGAADSLEIFLRSLHTAVPSAARIENTQVTEVSLRGEKGFRIASDLAE